MAVWAACGRAPDDSRGAQWTNSQRGQYAPTAIPSPPAAKRLSSFDASVMLPMAIHDGIVVAITAQRTRRLSEPLAMRDPLVKEALHGIFEDGRPGWVFQPEHPHPNSAHDCTGWNDLRSYGT